MQLNSSIRALFLGAVLLAALVLHRWPDKHAHLIVCDVGQGDAILIIEGFVQVLIDGGRTTAVMDCLNSYMPFWDRQLELVVATHPDADHINGLTTVLQTYHVQQLLLGGGKQTADFEAFRQAVEKEVDAGAKMLNPSLGTRFKLGNIANMIIISSHQGEPMFSRSDSQVAEQTLSAQSETDEREVRNYNDESIVLFLTFGQTKVLLTGDVEKEGEQALLTQGLLLETDVLKVGHHGSKSSSTQAFIAKIQPEFSLISVGEKNSYGHPHAEVVARLLSSGSHIKRTDLEGHIELVATRLNYWFQ